MLLAATMLLVAIMQEARMLVRKQAAKSSRLKSSLMFGETSTMLATNLPANLRAKHQTMESATSF